MAMYSDNDNGKPLDPKAQVLRFKSFAEYIHAAETREKVPGTCNSSHDGDAYFTGTNSWADAVKLARDGWPQGTERVNAISRRLEAKVLHRIVREDTRYDVEGMGFDVARYLDGEPEHWVQPEESTFAVEGQRHVKIEVSMMCSGGISADIIMRRGAAIAALVELLEYSGQRVELWLTSANAGHNGHLGNPVHVTHIRVKAYDQPLDPARVAFALVHPSTFRRFMFALQEGARPDLAKRSLGVSGYGCVTNAVKEDDTSIYLPAMFYGDERWESEDSAETWILAILAKQGVELRDDAN